MDLFDLFCTISIKTDEFERGLNEASGKVSGFGDKVKNGLATVAKIGAAAIGVTTTAVTAFAASSVKAGAQFDSAMSNVAAISGATGAEFDKLREKALEMGSKTKFSASEAADAFSYMAMAGWKTGDMLSGIEGIMNLAAASGEDLALTSDIVTDALTAFGMTAGKSGHFADVLAVASSNANTNVSMMGETFKYVAPIAGAMGYSAEDAALAIGLMANSSVKGSQAGTALRSILTRLAKPTKESQTAMDALGISITNSDGSMKSLGDVIFDLRDGFSGLTETEKTTYAAMLGGQEAMSGLLAIVNAAPADVEKLTSALSDCDGAAAEMAATMEDNLQGDITKFKSALEGAQIVISDQLTPTLREFVQFGTDAIGTLSTAFQNGGLSGAMEALGTILSDGLNMVIEQLPKMVDAGMQLLGALGQGLLDNLPTITSATVEIVTMLADGIIKGLPALASGAVEIISALASGIGQAAPELIPAAVEAVAKFLEGLTNPTALNSLIGGALQLIEGLVEGIVKAVPLLIEYGPEIVANLVAGILSALPKLLEVGGQLIAGLLEGLVQAIVSIPAAIAKVAGAIVDGFKALFGIHSPSTVFAEMGAFLIEGLLQGISGAWESIVEFFGGAVDGLTQFLGEAWDGIKLAASEAWEAIGRAISDVWGAITQVWDAATSFFGDIWNNVKGAAEEAAGKIGGALSDAWAAASKAWGAAMGFFSKIWNGISGAFAGAAGWFGGVFSDAWGAVTSAWSGVTDFFGGVWNDITGVFGSVWSKFTEIGGNIVSGLKNGVSRAWSNFIGFITDKVGGIISAVKNMLGIHSPSTVFAGIGGNMALGIGEGWNDEYNAIKRKIEGGLDFGTASVGLVANTAGYSAPRSVQNAPQTGVGGAGNTYVTINSPVAVDAVTAAREWQKTAQRMAMAY